MKTIKIFIPERSIKLVEGEDGVQNISIRETTSPPLVKIYFESGQVNSYCGFPFLLTEQEQ